jgi:tetratricopeptide (TPR) repeat protein
MWGRTSISILLLSMTLTAAARAGDAAAGKVPITTTSADAREAYVRGRDLAEKLRIQQGRAEYERAVQLDPNFALAYLNLAGTQPTTKDFFDTLAKAVALADQVSDGERLMIRGAEAGGNADNATQLKIYNELVTKYPADERALNLLGNALFGTQDYAAAIAQYEKVVKIAPNYSPVYNQLGYSYRFLGELGKAEAAFKKYIELIPDDPNPYDSYAELLLKVGRFDESIVNYRKALAIDPTFANSHLGIATDLDLQGKGKDARRELDTLLQGAQDDGQRRNGLFAKTVSYVHEGDLAAAQGELDKQYALCEKIGDALAMSGDLVLMGNLALEAGDAAAAETRYRRALEVVEASASVAAANKENQRRFQPYRAGRVALARNDLSAAKAQSAAFSEKVATSGNAFQKKLAHELAGQVALAGKNYDLAIAELSQASAIDPYNVYRLSLAYAGKGEAAKAKELATRAEHDNTLVSLNHAFVRRLLRNSAGSPGASAAGTQAKRSPGAPDGR